MTHTRGSAFDFFYSHAVPPDGKGRAAYARILARCEEFFYNHEWRIDCVRARGMMRCKLLDSNGVEMIHEELDVREVDATLARMVRAELVARRRGLL